MDTEIADTVRYITLLQTLFSTWGITTKDLHRVILSTCMHSFSGGVEELEDPVVLRVQEEPVQAARAVPAR